MRQETTYTELFSNPGVVGLQDIPVLNYGDFCDFVDLLMGEEGTHCLSYFVLPERDMLRFICCMAADENHAVVIFSHVQPAKPVPTLDAISARHLQFHLFEREIHENSGVGFTGHPWLKPIRFPFNSADWAGTMDNYPFYNITGEELHEVGVGPIHAGVIEPGYFRFICHGEHVHHLEIHLGYQHRGVEQLFLDKSSLLQKMVLAESIAGDTTIGHAMTFAGLMEVMGGLKTPENLDIERTIALELERIAVHIGDTAALCNDVAYQFGQVVCEALRTIVINTTQLWCGNRFGKGLIRPGGTHYPLSPALIEMIRKNLQEVAARYRDIAERIFSLPSVLGRFEGIGKVTTMQASLCGAVGMAARSSGMYRDIRWSHPYAAFRETPYLPVILPGGDVHARAILRKFEIEKSSGLIESLLDRHQTETHPMTPFSQPAIPVKPGSLGIALTEGWRGEIIHIAITDETGKIILYKIKDPSFHNWMALALAVRNQEISDFPLCNKSFNLSYCGNDL